MISIEKFMIHNFIKEFFWILFNLKETFSRGLKIVQKSTPPPQGKVKIVLFKSKKNTFKIISVHI